MGVSVTSKKETGKPVSLRNGNMVRRRLWCIFSSQPSKDHQSKKNNNHLGKVTALMKRKSDKMDVRYGRCPFSDTAERGSIKKRKINGEGDGAPRAARKD